MRVPDFKPFSTKFIAYRVQIMKTSKGGVKETADSYPDNRRNSLEYFTSFKFIKKGMWRGGEGINQACFNFS